MRTFNELYDISRRNNWRLNPESKMVKMLVEKENADFKILGNYYCPCKRQKTKENICPCQNAQTEIDQDGHCHCLLYWDTNPMVIEVIFFNNTDNINIKQIYNGETSRIEVWFIETKGVQEIEFANVNGLKVQAIRIFQYKNQWFMVNDAVVLTNHLQDIDNGKLSGISQISNITIKITKGDISKGYTKKVNELLNKWLFG